MNGVPRPPALRSLSPVHTMTIENTREQGRTDLRMTDDALATHSFRIEDLIDRDSPLVAHLTPGELRELHALVWDCIHERRQDGNLPQRHRSRLIRRHIHKRPYV